MPNLHDLVANPLFRRMLMRSLILGAVMFAAFFYLAPKDKARQRHPSDRGSVETLMFTSMSTRAAVTLYSDLAEPPFRAAFDAVRTEFNRVSEVCNLYDPASELSRLNASAAKQPFVCSGELWEILTAARRFYVLTGGAFDVSVTPLMKLWGFHRQEKRLPSDSELTAARVLVGLDKVVFDDAAKTVLFSVPGMSLDLGGIAKGWALDRAARAVQTLGFTRGYLDLGGNVLTLSDPPPGKSVYRAGVRDPFARDRTCASVSLCGEAIATSGGYERYVEIDGVKYSHIIDPRTGRPAEGIVSASVIVPGGMASDALSTSLLLLGPDFVEKMRAEFPGARALLIRGSAAKNEFLRFGDGWTSIQTEKVP